MATTQSEENKAKEEEDEKASPAKGYVALVRLVLPIATLVLSILYIENTYGRISTENLYYPYFVICFLVLLTLSVLYDEFKYLYRYSADRSLSTSIKNKFNEWDRSIGLVIAGIIYINLIPIAGFFIASFFAVVLIMLIGGIRDPKLLIGLNIALLVAVYLIFVMLMGLNPPTGVAI